MIGALRFPLVLLALAACGSGVVRSGSGQPSSQQFTRAVRAVPANLVQSAVTVFGRYGIPIAEADEPGGRVRTIPVNLRAIARRFDEAPLSCPQGTPREAVVPVTFDVQVRRTDSGSVLSIETQREGDNACVVRAAFVSTLLEEIAGAAGGA